MARRRPEDGFARLLEAALAVFSRRGVASARIADVAREMGVSAGTIYQYVENKDALFYVLVDRGLEAAPPQLPAELPIRAPPAELLLARLREQIEAATALPRLAAAPDVVDPAGARAEAEAVVAELFDLTAATRRWVDVLERSAPSLPQIGALFVLDVRRRVFGALEGWVASRMAAGAFRERDPVVSARFVVETVTFFARHRHHEPDPATLAVADATIRDTAIALVVDALLAR